MGPTSIPSQQIRRTLLDDPALIRLLAARMGEGHSLSLVRSDRAMTDCRPVSLFSIQTARQLGEEIGSALDMRRFRANVYLDLGSASGFAEDGFVGRTVRLGPKVTIVVLERDARCKMITIDPDTAEPSGAILRQVSRAHDGMAGVYGAVLAWHSTCRSRSRDLAEPIATGYQRAGHESMVVEPGP